MRAGLAQEGKAGNPRAKRFMDNNGNNNQPNNGGNKKNGKNNSSWLAFVLITLVFLLLISVVSNRMTSSTTEEISYTEFKRMVEDGEVESVTIGSSTIEIVPKTDEEEDSYSSYYTYTTTYYTAVLDDEELLAFLEENDVEVSGEIPNTTATIIANILAFVIPLVLLWAIFAFAMRRMNGSSGGVMGMSKNTAKVYVEKSTGVTFEDVAGQDEAKESLQEVVDFLHNPHKYTAIGAKLPKGVLLVGPPGTGKTLLAKAVAGEAKVPFFSLAGSDFVEMFVGLGASRVRDLFKEAQKQAPCIIFIDEIDAIGKSRESRYGGGGNDEREQTLNALLSEMDGFDSSKGLLILAATNRPEVLDKALLRPGRFDRRVIVDKPDLKGRYDTLKVHSKGVALDETVDLNEIALATAGCVGSDLANMVNEAAINAVKNGRHSVSQADLWEAFETVIAGKEKKDRILGPKEKRLVAYHEVGHALVSALQKDSEPVQKITIVPRTMGSLGYTLQTPEEEKYLNTKDELEARLVTYMAGRAAEEITCDSVTTGAANDIEMATKLARAMVTQYGMSEEFGLMGLESVEDYYLDGRPVMNCGEATAAKIDDVVEELLRKAYDKAKYLLSTHREVLEDITNYLYEHETITGKEFMDIFRRWVPEGGDQEAVEAEQKAKLNAEGAEAEKAESAPAENPAAAAEAGPSASEKESPQGEKPEEGGAEDDSVMTAPDEAFEEDDL